MSSNPKQTMHVSPIVKCVEMALSILERAIISRDKKVFLKFYKLLVRPHLEYVVIFWNLHLKHEIALIERVQCQATKCIQGLKIKVTSYAWKFLRLTLLKTKNYD